MGASSFNEMELDAIGEIMNISLGASATAVSTMLGTKVNITTPVVLVQRKDEFEFKRLEPAIGVEIDYVEGLEGKNIMMFRKEDIRIIVSTMMGGDIPEAEFEMDELYISAICEVMNQMMGSSATALSEFLGTIVNISTPKSFEIGEPEEFKNKYFIEADGMVVVRFRLEIEDKLNSEFMNIMPTKLAKRLLEPFADSLGLTKEPEPSTESVQPTPEPEPPMVSEPESPVQAAEPEPVQAPEPEPVPVVAPVPQPQPAPQPQPMPQMVDPSMQAAAQQGMQQPPAILSISFSRNGSYDASASQSDATDTDADDGDDENNQDIFFRFFFLQCGEFDYPASDVSADSGFCRRGRGGQDESGDADESTSGIVGRNWKNQTIS